MDHHAIFLHQMVPCPIDMPAQRLSAFLRESRLDHSVKTACHEGECGACSVIQLSPSSDGRCQARVLASCLTPLAQVANSAIFTVHALTDMADRHLVIQAFVETHAAQCGFCTPGFVMALTGALLQEQLNETHRRGTILAKALEERLDGNLCRCTGYQSQKRAIQWLCQHLQPDTPLLPWSLAEIRQALLNLPSSPMRSEDEPQPPLWVGGGTDLMLKPPLPDQPLAPLPAALPIQRHGESLKVDAAMTWSQLQADPLWQEHFPGLSHFFQTFASAPIRDSGTLGGNLVNASPIGDGAILFLAAGIQVETDRGRTLDIDHFFLSYRQTALHQGERLTQLILPLHGRVYFSKVTKRPLLDVASVNAALWLGARPNGSPHIRLSVGGLSPTPKRLVEAEEWLQTYWPCGEPTLPWRGLQERLAHATAPIDDIRGSAEYKQTLVFRLLLDLIGQATSPSKVTREILVT